MLPDYAGTVLVVPVLLALFYMAGKGLRGYIGFAEASVIGIGITLVLFVICGFWNADFSELKGYVEFQMQASVCNTICQVLIKGYLLIVGLSMLEFVMYLYLRVEKRRRGMLVWTVSVPRKDKGGSCCRKDNDCRLLTEFKNKSQRKEHCKTDNRERARHFSSSPII